MRSIPRVLSGILLLTLAAPAKADEGKSSDDGLVRYEFLLKRQPFMLRTMEEAVPVKQGPPASFRFTGLMSVGEKILVGIENVPAQKSYLLKPGVPEEGLLVKEVQIKQKCVTLVANGETIRMDLVDSSPLTPAILPMAASLPVPPHAHVTMSPPATHPAIVPDPQPSVPVQRRIHPPIRRP